ncbi:MAG: bifunctional adenosylcobinamide kinase/adenosylcobinamide-phosphate guanylyltransferase [Deltaproteobacteria bacterium]|nr:bifunctional adenosylcobinamide kinase/adenosylcobinamide-phosphate guanylyltransferase [Deltaproteobacteria bacterium]
MWKDPFDSIPHLVLGGARSGKSAFAEQTLASFHPPYVYVATAQVLDEEMRDRVARHQARRTADWETLETPYDLSGALGRLGGAGKAVLVDCLTIWISNLLLRGDGEEIETRIHELCLCIQRADYPLVLVSNEVGWGIVPDNALARQFRDLAGFANQKVAAACRSVTLVAAGIPLRLK